MITTFNLFVAISWIVSGVISAFLSSSFLLKNPKRRLNQLFASGFILWSLSMILNGTVFAIAYYSLAIANIFRDITIVCGIFSAFILFTAAIGIFFGAESLNWRIYFPIVIVSIILSVFGALNDWVTNDGLGGFKTTDNLTGKICVQVISMFFVLIANILLFLTYKASENRQVKKRIGFFVVGYAAMLLGVLFFILDGLFDIFFDISPYLFTSLALISWVIGPLLMFVGFYAKAAPESTSYFRQQLEKDEKNLMTHMQ